MRYLYIGLIVVFTALVLLFKFQNLETATVSLFSASITLPVSALVFGVYVLGMLTGACLFASLKSWVRGARSPPESATRPRDRTTLTLPNLRIPTTGAIA